MLTCSEQTNHLIAYYINYVILVRQCKNIFLRNKLNNMTNESEKLLNEYSEYMEKGKIPTVGLNSGIGVDDINEESLPKFSEQPVATKEEIEDFKKANNIREAMKNQKDSEEVAEVKEEVKEKVDDKEKSNTKVKSKSSSKKVLAASSSTEEKKVSNVEMFFYNLRIESSKKININSVSKLNTNPDNVINFIEREDDFFEDKKLLSKKDKLEAIKLYECIDILYKKFKDKTVMIVAPTFNLNKVPYFKADTEVGYLRSFEDDSIINKFIMIKLTDKVYNLLRDFRKSASYRSDNLKMVFANFIRYLNDNSVNTEDLTKNFK